jgi:hypothetical protein
MWCRVLYTDISDQALSLPNQYAYKQSKLEAQTQELYMMLKLKQLEAGVVPDLSALEMRMFAAKAAEEKDMAEDTNTHLGTCDIVAVYPSVIDAAGQVFSRQEYEVHSAFEQRIARAATKLTAQTGVPAYILRTAQVMEPAVKMREVAVPAYIKMREVAVPVAAMAPGYPTTSVIPPKPE